MLYAESDDRHLMREGEHPGAITAKTNSDLCIAESF